MPCTCRSFGDKSFGAVGLHVWMDGMVWHEIYNRNYYSTTATTTTVTTMTTTVPHQISWIFSLIAVNNYYHHFMATIQDNLP